MLSFKPTFSLSSFTFIKRLFSSSLSAIRVVSSAYLRLLIFLPATLIPACSSSSPAFHIMYSAAAAKSLQSCPTLCVPIDSSPPGSLSLGFSRQEHWSGLPSPPPMRESEVAQLCPTLSDTMDCSLPGSSVHGIFPGKSTGVGCHCLLQYLNHVCRAVA